MRGRPYRVTVVYGPSAIVWRSLGRVAKWQTRWLQVPVGEIPWGFKSPLAHWLDIVRQPLPAGQSARVATVLWSARSHYVEVNPPLDALDVGQSVYLPHHPLGLVRAAENS